jgi:arylsulfatase A-like enzyme
MERMASEGMKFTNAYATPVCTPSRISLLTGMNASHHGVTNWTSPKKNNNTDYVDDQMAAVSWNINGLSPVPGIPNTVYATPFPQLLKNAGYFTIHIGKAHCAPMGTPGANPYNLGFMVNISGHAAGHPQSYLGKDNFGNNAGKSGDHAVPDLEEYFGTDTFLTEALTLEAIKAMEAPVKNMQPFFLNMAQYAIHLPFDKDQRFFSKYIDAGLTETEAKYASLIEGMDKSLGDIMDWLQNKKIDKNTIIIFMSDNGGLSMAPRSGVAFSRNNPLKSGKGSVCEGGIREPMLVKWPGVIKQGTVTDQYLIIEDFFPSILQMAGIQKYKTVQTIDGKSFVPVLKNKNYLDTTRSLVWHYPNKWLQQGGPGISYKSAIRQGKWKLVYDMRKGKSELYNLQDDIGETNDLSNTFSVVTKKMAELLTYQLKKNNAAMPSFKNSGKQVPWPDEVQK